jgi:hypothetical protein
MDFDAPERGRDARDTAPRRAAPSPIAEPTRIDFGAPAGGPPKDEDEVDDLFMELLDD